MEHAKIIVHLDKLYYRCEVLSTFINAQIFKIAADDLAHSWHHDIYNHHGGVGHLPYLGMAQIKYGTDIDLIIQPTLDYLSKQMNNTSDQINVCSYYWRCSP